MVDFLVRQRRYVEVALIGKIEGKLQTGDEVAFCRRKGTIFRVGVGADLERNVMQRSEAERLCIEDFIPAERAAE